MEPVYQQRARPDGRARLCGRGHQQIRLGVAVINLPFVSPAYLAKQAATVDVLSGGRLDLGLGIGWMPEEFTASGAAMARRGARAEEYLAVLRTLWAEEVSRSAASSTPCRPGGGPDAGAAARAAGAARRHGPAGHGAGRPDRRRLDHLQPRPTCPRSAS